MNKPNGSNGPNEPQPNNNPEISAGYKLAKDYEPLPSSPFTGMETEFEFLDKHLEMVTGSKALTKACLDNPFDYALKLRTGEVIAFYGAQLLNHHWIHLDVKPRDEQPKTSQLPYSAMRGIDVRLSDIVWVMDAPEGS